MPPQQLPLPSPPKTKKELLARIRPLVGTGEWILIPPATTGGTGSPGNYLQQLLGADGSNKAIPDATGVEVKWHSGGGLLTLQHHDPEGGVEAIRPMLEKFGKRRKYGLSFRHTVSDTSNLKVTRSEGKIFVRPKIGPPEPSVYWTESDFLQRATTKLADLILVQGKIKKEGGLRFMRIDSALNLTKFKAADFLNAVGGRYILIEFGAREQLPETKSLRNRGTKLRMKLCDLGEIWEKIEEIK
jgi:MvaI/BcnI restriction endonuclease family